MGRWVGEVGGVGETPFRNFGFWILGIGEAEGAGEAGGAGETPFRNFGFWILGIGL